MGTFTFKWPHAAEEVYVTGTFDNWSKSEKLEKVGNHFEKTVTLPENSENIFYKFVVDGNWTTDHEAPIAKDSEGNDNNLLKVEDIVHKEASPMASVLNTVSPESTTVGLASQVPLEPKKDAHVEEKNDTPAEKKEAGPPGTFPETPAADADKQFSVNPLPATDFAVNPIELTAGEKVPKDVAANGINDHVTLDKESYEKSDRIPGLTGLTAPTELAPTSIGTIIPESSLPIVAGDVLTNSAAPDSSTAALAANVPLEHHKAPEVVKQSQEKSGEEVGASGVEKLAGEKLDEKAEVEEELLSKVPEAPSTAEGTSGKGTDKTEHTKSAVDYLAEGAGVVGVGLVAAGLAAKDAIVHAAQSETAQNAAHQVTEAATNAKDTVVASTQSAAQQAAEVATNAKDTVVAGSQSAAQQTTDAAISAKNSVVAGSQSAAQQATDAAVSAKDTAVASGQSAASSTVNAKDSAVAGTQSAAQQTSDATVNAKDTVVASTLSAVESTKVAAGNAAAQLPDSVKNVLPASVQAAIPKPETQEELVEKISPEVPIEVKESIAESGQGPEATTNTAAVEQKTAVESELLKEVDEVKAFDDKPAKAADNVPSEVKESITEAGQAPEAASSETAVDNKAAVESELLKEVEATKPIDEQPKKSETLPTEPASTSVESKLLDGAKDSLPSVDDKPKDFTTSESKAAESAPHLDLPTPPAVVPLVATPAPDPEVKTEVATEFPTEVTNGGSEAASPKPVEESSSTAAALPILPKAVETTTSATPAVPAEPEAPTTPSKATTTSPAASSSKGTGAESPATTADKKKKNRLSSFFGKIKEKVAHKDSKP